MSIHWPPAPRHARRLPLEALRASATAHIASHEDEERLCPVCARYVVALRDAI